MGPRRLSSILLVAVPLVTAPPAAGAVLFSDSLAEPVEGSLITNEYAHWNPGAGVESPHWEMTSGSLFAGGWTGTPDDCAPDRTSSGCTNSAVFRLNTRRFDFGSVRVEVALRANAWASTPSTPAVAWDGVHLWLRYRSEASLYYASVNRRDGAVMVKKKCPGGSSNGGTYHTLASRSSLPAPLGSWQRVAASIDTAADGSVAIDVFREGARVLSATDSGTGCAPITAPGAAGVRGDNLDFSLRDFGVSELRAPAPPPSPGAAPQPGPAAGAPPAQGPVSGAGGGDGTPVGVRFAVRPAGRRFRRALRLRVRAGADVRKVVFQLDRRRIRVDRRAPFFLRHAPTRRLRRGVHRLSVSGYDRHGRRVARRSMRVRYLGRG